MECKGSQAAAVKTQACECEHARVRCQEVGKANGLPRPRDVCGACGCAIRKWGKPLAFPRLRDGVQARAGVCTQIRSVQ